eukprot:TRINITY_DN6113_c5_g1_i1.p2 TRINITY_DN6113_c5_g1~~TRINITY_DN6113_c5_g1_i1.p2  ORF type:complete len:135 (+),score=39.64 TRINITY_DN6113_c5_g1_i1:333-737(+)
MEPMVGLSLIGIGLLGLHENRQAKAPSLKQIHRPARKKRENWSLFTTGVIQGFTGSDHFVGVLPALALPSPLSVSLYLLSFALGTLLAMALFTALTGELSALFSRNTSALSLAVSCLSIFIGATYLLSSTATHL